jgi:hypothetical protein
MKPFPWILLLLLPLFQPTRSNAQLWRYLKDDPKADQDFEKSLDREACSVTTRSYLYYGVKRDYKVRSYCIQGFDSVPGKIVISPTSHGHSLLIKSPGNRIKIEDTYGLVKVHFLRPELLEVVYSPRGGSDQGYDYVMILGLSKKRLCVVTEFLTINESTSPDEYHLHEVRLKLRGQTLRDCELIANVRDMLKTDTSRSREYDRKSVYLLKFDYDRKIFYNKIEHGIPMIQLGPGEEYCYIDTTWYRQDIDDTTKKNVLSKVH